MNELTPAGYIQILSELKRKIKQAKSSAALTVNVELLKVYWEIGTTVLEQQKVEGWGAKIIDRLSKDLKSEFTDFQGLSVRNIKYMRSFAEAYPDFLKMQPPSAQLQNTDNQSNIIVQAPLAQMELNGNFAESAFVQAPLAQLTWYHHITLLDKVKDPTARLFYIYKTIENRWTRNELLHQIDSNLFARQGSLTSNFKATLQGESTALTQQLFKDPYYFDFLDLGEKAKERDIENALTENITKFLLELGEGFAYMGRQRKLLAGEKEYFIDLLFYHTKLRRHIIIELKIGDFLPEYVGKMNLYLGLADDQLRGEHIGRAHV